MSWFNEPDPGAPDDAVTCEECNGTGWTETEYRRYACVHCNGTGLVEEDFDEEEWWEELHQ
jgi:DnaJ-class molecular chaperone